MILSWFNPPKPKKKGGFCGCKIGNWGTPSDGNVKILGSETKMVSESPNIGIEGPISGVPGK